MEDIIRYLDIFFHLPFIFKEITTSQEVLKKNSKEKNTIYFKKYYFIFT